MPQVTTAGDAGDIIYTMCIMKHMDGGPHSLLLEEDDPYTNIGKNPGSGKALIDFMHEFVVDQQYISEFRVIKPDDRPMWRSGGFRGANLHRRDEPLMQAHLNHLNQVTGIGLKVDSSKPWLTVKRDKMKAAKSSGRVIVNRTSRYNNKRFPWAQIVNFYGPRIAFIGLPHEHQAFCMEFGGVEYFHTKNMKAMAELIAGCALFIGNQSCAFAIAEGLKVDSIQETSMQIPDCIFKRDNVQHVWDGKCKLPNFDGGEPLVTHDKSLNIGLVSTMKTPPEPGWTYPGASSTDYFHTILDAVCRLPEMRGKTQKEVEDIIKQYTLDRIPEYYRPSSDGELPRRALAFAGYQ